MAISIAAWLARPKVDQLPVRENKPPSSTRFFLRLGESANARDVATPTRKTPAARMPKILHRYFLCTVLSSFRFRISVKPLILMRLLIPEKLWGHHYAGARADTPEHRSAQSVAQAMCRQVLQTADQA